MGRAPCCDKANVKKGPWSPEEDAKLKAYIEQHGTGGNWIALPQKIGLKRCGKSCRLRWLNYLRPNIKHGGFSEEEDNIICSLYVSIGSRWSIIAAQLPGRTDNDIKNYWNTRLKKKLLGKQRKEQQLAQARRATTLKQEMKRSESTQNSVLPAAVFSQTPYNWPADLSCVPMPVASAASIQDYDLNSQATLRNLLTKLGGRFSEDHQAPYATTVAAATTMNSHYPCDISFPQDQLYGNLINPGVVVNAASAVNNCTSDPPLSIFQGFENFPNEFAELFCDSPQQLDVLQGFFGVESVVNNGSTGTASTESTTSWGDMSSLVNYSPLVSDYENCPQPQGIMLHQDVANYEDSKYYGIQ